MGRAQGAGWSAENILYLDVDGGYRDLYTCKNSPCRTCKVCAFIVCQLSLNAQVSFKKSKTQNAHHKGGLLRSALNSTVHPYTLRNGE